MQSGQKDHQDTEIKDHRNTGNTGSVDYRFDPPQGAGLVRDLDIRSLEDSRDNHFQKIRGENWEEFVESIRQFGVVTPLIVRPKAGQPGRYEILAGHNRKSGAVQAGLRAVPCITVDVNDVDASVLIGITNQQREGVSDLEWGWTYRTTLEALKRDTEAASSSGRPPGERSIDIVARKYGVNRKTCQRKIRLTYLIPQLYELGLKKKYPQKALVDLSYLPVPVQVNVVQAVSFENIVMTEAAAAGLRRAAAADPDLSIGDVLYLCRDLGKAGPPVTRRRSDRYDVPACLFPKGLPKNRRQEHVLAAMKYILEHDIDLGL